MNDKIIKCNIHMLAYGHCKEATINRRVFNKVLYRECLRVQTLNLNRSFLTGKVTHSYTICKTGVSFSSFSYFSECFYWSRKSPAKIFLPKIDPPEFFFLKNPKLFILNPKKFLHLVTNIPV